LSFKNKTIDLGFVVMDLTEHCVISTVKEGVLIDLEHIAAFHEIFAEYYFDRHFGFIDNRINQYAINLNPEVYNTRYPKMVGIAIVCYTENCIKNANFEKTFYNWPFGVFKDLEEAKQWIDKLKSEK
tara:strand:+ start:1947 stop:2327 length:381 start_codon:yes stop_codon:yes gene_type:complete